mmetsp:Transcript_2453/g.7277  ORF Transcript_2453/g.7277 Transcript_2453/m.7277 type:complete len:379 (-) Transcript_2453:147-1283(-)
MVVGGDATHVVVHGGDHRNGLLGDVHAGEDGRRFRDARQALRQRLGGDVVEVQVNVVLLGPHAAPRADLHRHGARHHVARRQVLGGGRIALHEALALRVAQNTALAAAALGDEAASAIDARRMELHELKILQRQPRARHHRAAVAGARVRAGGGEVRAAVPTGGQHRLVRAEAVQRTVLHAHGQHAHALALMHQQVEREVLDEELRVVPHGLPVERVQQRVACAVGRARAAVRLPPLAVVERLPTEGALVDLPLFVAAEGQPVVLQLNDGLGRLAAHVLDGVLVAQPVAALDGVVGVPAPVVFRAVAQRSVNPPLCRHCVRARGEELCDARCVEAVLREADGSAQAGTARTHHHRIVLVVDDGVVAQRGRRQRASGAR